MGIKLCTQLYANDEYDFLDYSKMWTPHCSVSQLMKRFLSWKTILNVKLELPNEIHRR